MNIIACLQETVSNRKRYLGGDSILKLECFAYGYMESLRHNGLVERTGPPFEPFLWWLALHKNGKEWKSGWSVGWGKTLLSKFNGDEDKAFGAFGVLLDEYASFVPVKRAALPVPVGGGGDGMHQRFKSEDARIPNVVDIYQLSPPRFLLFDVHVCTRALRNPGDGIPKH